MVRLGFRVTLAFLLFIAQAFAAPTPKELSKARAKFQQATELEQAGNYTAAIELFREVGQVRMTPQVRYHIAFCEEKLGRLVAALGGYELAAADAKKVNKNFEKEVAARAEDLRARIPKLVIRRGKNADAARIELDGVELGASSIGSEMKLDPGPHQVTARAEGFERFAQTVVLRESKLETVEVKLVSSEPEAAATAPEPEPEPHDTGVAEDESSSNAFPLVLGAVGVVSLGASGAFFLMKQSAIEDLDAQCNADRDCPPESKDTYDKAKLYDTVSMVTLGVGVVSLGVAATLLFTGGSSEKPQASKGVRILPAAPHTSAGVSLHAAF